MEREKSFYLKYSVWFIYIIFAVGILGHSFELTRKLMLELTPYTLLICAFVVIIPYLIEKKGIILLWFLTTFVGTFILEVIGVKTGAVFGNYTYGDVMGLKLFEVPVIIGINWVFVILGAVLISNLITPQKIASSLIAALLALLFDLSLEPVAVGLGYWEWAGNSIPTQNYIAWFVIGFSAAFYFNLLNPKINLSLARHYFIAQIVFFFSINLILIR